MNPLRPRTLSIPQLIHVMKTSGYTVMGMTVGFFLIPPAPLLPTALYFATISFMLICAFRCDREIRFRLKMMRQQAMMLDALHGMRDILIEAKRRHDEEEKKKKDEENDNDK